MATIAADLASAAERATFERWAEARLRAAG
jgi:hypothetical protein